MMMINRRRVCGGKKDSFDFIKVLPKYIPNSYISNANGSLVPYDNSWRSTDYVPISGFKGLSGLNTDFRYSAFYDKNKAFISSAYIGEIPSNAEYVRVSAPSSYNTVIYLAKESVTTPIYMRNKYVKDDGAIVDYSNWSIYKLDVTEDAYVFTTLDKYYQASYNNDGTVFEAGKYILHKPKDGYVLASRSTVSELRFCYGFNYGVIDYNE